MRAGHLGAWWPAALTLLLAAHSVAHSEFQWSWLGRLSEDLRSQGLASESPLHHGLQQCAASASPDPRILEWSLWNTAAFYHRQAQHARSRDRSHEHALAARKYYQLAVDLRGDHHGSITANYQELSQMLDRFRGEPRLPIEAVFVVHLSAQPGRGKRLRARLEAQGLARKYPVHWVTDDPLLGDAIVQERLGLRMAAQRADEPFGKMWDVESGVLYTEKQLARYIATTASHATIWSRAVEAGMDSVLVLENDIRLINGFEHQVSEALTRKLPPNWELLMLDALSHAMASDVMFGNETEGWVQCTKCTLSGAYIIRRAAMERALAALKLIPNMLTEEVLMHIQGSGLAYAYLPFPCVQEMLDTTVQSKLHMEKLQGFYNHYFSKYGDLYPSLESEM